MVFTFFWAGGGEGALLECWNWIHQETLAQLFLRSIPAWALLCLYGSNSGNGLPKRWLLSLWGLLGDNQILRNMEEG